MSACSPGPLLCMGQGVGPLSHMSRGGRQEEARDHRLLMLLNHCPRPSPPPQLATFPPGMADLLGSVRMGRDEGGGGGVPMAAVAGVMMMDGAGTHPQPLLARADASLRDNFKCTSPLPP
uniref:Uncharacterized protein n=1 Tax=Knipowitschia caucasica TaxID=637954 RepID=A0AAV2J2V6_KNICA